MPKATGEPGNWWVLLANGFGTEGPDALADRAFVQKAHARPQHRCRAPGTADGVLPCAVLIGCRLIGRCCLLS